MDRRRLIAMPTVTFDYTGRLQSIHHYLTVRRRDEARTKFTLDIQCNMSIILFFLLLVAFSFFPHSHPLPLMMKREGRKWEKNRQHTSLEMIHNRKWHTYKYFFHSSKIVSFSATIIITLELRYPCVHFTVRETVRDRSSHGWCRSSYKWINTYTSVMGWLFRWWCMQSPQSSTHCADAVNLFCNSYFAFIYLRFNYLLDTRWIHR